MKKMITVLFVGFTLITVCLIYLLRSGVSLRTAPLIKPSVIQGDLRVVARAVLLRMSREFQDAHYVNWGILPETEESMRLMRYFKEEHENIFKRPVHSIENAETASINELRECPKPCWLMLPETKANELGPNAFVEEKIRPLNEPYFNLTYIPFSPVGDVPESCTSQKRLTLECLKLVSIHEAQRKMEKGRRYFFMRKYIDKDHFLFVQTNGSQRE